VYDLIVFVMHSVVPVATLNRFNTTLQILFIYLHCFKCQLFSVFLVIYFIISQTFSAAMPLAGQQEGHPACKSFVTTIPKSLGPA